MAYTVKEISKLSGVTVRCLHFYEEIGLLKPAYYGSNGYRYYEEEQLLQLQQILLYKEMGLTLGKISKILGKSDFDRLAALYAHGRELRSEKEKICKLIKTVDKTIKHLTGKIKMKDKEFFNGFTEIKYDLKTASSAEKLVINSARKEAKEKPDEAFHARVNLEAGEIYRSIASCLDRGLKPGSKEVQLLIKKHYAFADRFQIVSKSVYRAMAQLYREKPEFRKQLDFFHPKLADYMSMAMEIFADSL